MSTTFPLAKRIAATAFAFRGYNVVNLGRTPELLEHSVYGPILARHLEDASELAGDVLGREVDLVARVRARQETVNLDTYGEDLALIVAIGLAHVSLLKEFFGVTIAKARMMFGYSLGEITALIAGGVYSMKDLLGVLLTLSDDAVALARDVSLGVLFSRGSALDLPRCSACVCKSISLARVLSTFLLSCRPTVSCSWAKKTRWSASSNRCARRLPARCSCEKSPPAGCRCIPSSPANEHSPIAPRRFWRQSRAA